MKGRINFKLWALCSVLAMALLVPAVGQAKEKGEWGKQVKEWKAKVAKELKLSPDKEKQFMAVSDKYAGIRKGIFESMKKSQDELQKAMAAAKPDEAKVKQLVQAITGEQDKLMNSFKEERNEEMALLSPLQQGQYLEVLHKWRKEMYGKHHPAKEMKGEKGKPEKK
jgi:Spy/CpxP family protein refolding chaperone